MYRRIAPAGTAGRAVLSLALALGIAAAAAGCLSQHAAAGNPDTTVKAVRIDPAKATQLSGPGGAAVTRPAGAACGQETVSVRQVIAFISMVLCEPTAPPRINRALWLIDGW
jgi:hypothetical protein